MIRIAALALGFASLVSLAVPAQAAAPKVVDRSAGGWNITRAVEGKLINCRAERKNGRRLDILSVRSNGDTYVSINGEGRNGTFQDTIVQPINEPDTGLQWNITAGANKARMWFTLDPTAVDIIAEAGGFRFLLGGSEDSGEISFGRGAAQAWAKAQRCIQR